MTFDAARNDGAGPGDITQRLLALRGGGRAEMDALFSLVYDRLRGFQLTTFRISPVQWFPAEERLVLHNEIQVSVTFRGGTLQQPRGGYAAARQFADLRTRVVNPGDVPFIPEPDTPLPDEVWYLVITDDFYWDSDMTIGAPVPGGLVAEFQRLADWKTRKGLKAGVVRISDIMRGEYGDFRAGARDLQEVLRNFLKFASREWNTY